MKISCHHDADGVSAGALFFRAKGLVVNEDEIEFPTEFGDIGEDVDVVLDQTPKEEFGGVVIDHHPQDEDETSYSLIGGDKPTGALVFDNFKDSIPSSEYWKVVVSTSGDASIEKTPAKVWKSSPKLLNQVGDYNYKRNNYSGGVFLLPIYKRLSSLINGACKKGDEFEAFRILYQAREPSDILNDPFLQNAREKVKKERRSSQNNGTLYDISDYFRYFTHESNYRVNGGICHTMMDEEEVKTVIVHNLKSNRMSIRGEMTNYVKDYFKDDDFVEIGGHDIAAGGKVMDLDKFQDKLFKLKI